MADKVPDTAGLNCPLPILHTTKAIQGIQSGRTLEVLATNQRVADFNPLCRQAGGELPSSSEDGGVYDLLINRLP